MSSSGIRYRRDGIPDPAVDTLLCIIAHVNSATGNTVLAGGKRLCNSVDFSMNAIFRPLATVKDIMKSFMAHVDRYAHRVRLFEHFQPEMDRIYKDETIPDDERYPRLFRYLKRTGDIEDYYCDLFHGMSKDLGPVVEALDTLTKYIRTVCAKGNTTQITQLSALIDSSITENFDGDESDCTHDTALECVEAAHVSLDLSPDLINSLDLTPSTRVSNAFKDPPPDRIPCWKMSVANRFPAHSLSVTWSELETFGIVLKRLKAAKYAVVGARELCNIRGHLATEMKMVLKLWTDRYEQWAGQTNGWEEETWDDNLTEDRRVNPGLPEDARFF